MRKLFSFIGFLVTIVGILATVMNYFQKKGMISEFGFDEDEDLVQYIDDEDEKTDNSKE